MALGEKLRTARLNAKLTIEQVAASTRIKRQIIEDIEREDFRRVAAPIYGKGFIRLFAVRVGLDPTPLVDEYVARFVNPVPIQLATEKSNVLQGSTKMEPLAPHQLSADALPDVVPQEQDLFSAPQRNEIIPPAAEPPMRAESSTIIQEPDQPGWPSRFVERAGRKISSLIEQVRSIRDPWRRRDFSLPVIRFVESPFKWLFVMLGMVVILIFLFSALSRVFHRPQNEAVSPHVEESRDQLQLAVEPPAPYID